MIGVFPNPGRLRYLLGARTRPVLYLHIGMHKTGTTAIQTAMYASGKQLARRRICYPKFEPNHSLAIRSLFSAQPDKIILHMRRGRILSEQVTEFNAHIAGQLRRIGSGESWKKVLISGESMSTLGARGVGQMKQFFDELVNDYRVIFYIRPPASYINSDAQERVKGGSTLKSLTTNPPLPRYRNRLEPFLELFGRDSLDLRLYQREALGNGLLQDFCGALDEPGLVEEISIGTRNRSWSADAVRIMDAYNQRYPLVLNGGDGTQFLNPDRPPDGVLKNVMQYIPGQKFSLVKKELDLLLERCSDDVEWMESVYGARIGDRPVAGESAFGCSDSGLSNGRIEEITEQLHRLCANVKADPERAQSSCDALLEQYGTNPELWFQRGVALIRYSDKVEAESALQKAIELDPDHFRAWNQLAAVRRQRGDLAGARAAAERSVRLSPETEAFRARLTGIRRQAWKRAPMNVLRRLRQIGRAETGNG